MISCSSKKPDLYNSVALLNSYLNLNLSKNSLNIALLCSPKLECVPNGSGIEVSGLFKFSSKGFVLGILSGTFLRPSKSSEKVKRFIFKSVKFFKAL